MHMPVKVKVVTVIERGEERDRLELSAAGKMFRKGDSVYLQYEEKLEEGIVNTTVKMKKEDVLILRSGAVKMRLHLLAEKETPGTYQSPYGLLQTTAATKRLTQIADNTANRGVIEAVYDLSLGGDHAGTYHLRIDYK
ncbi:YwiB family protein [Bacillus massilinigeriensis]|uniref:DUF1934 domain-containing protein n=1 Tax=Bacillus mediterraneensis TaxID=1805474 RepID=UPI0009F4818F|nr:DUF1934 domain-containing protein [Bacillus mediterraneensis]